MLAAAATVGGVLGTTTSAFALGNVTVHAATNAYVRVGTSITLTGLSVGDTDPTDTLTVTLSTSQGTVTLPNHVGLTLAPGNAWTDDSVSFTGLTAAVNTALTTATANVGAGSGSAAIGLSAYVATGNQVYSPSNGHFYEYVASPNIHWDAAQSAAALMSFMGRSGYLATIPSATVNSLITSKIPGALNVWIGAESSDNPGGSPQRVWKWADGPLLNTVFSNCGNWTAVCDFTPTTAQYNGWAGGEPNNSGAGGGAHSGEYVAVTNWNSADGAWNDLAPTAANISGYVVEYGDLVNGATSFTGLATTTQSIPILDVPGAPTGVSATGSSGQASVSFTAPVSNGGTAITGYTATSSPDGRTGTCNASPCTVSGLTNGSSYTFTVHATNVVGDSVESSASVQLPVYGPATPPRNVSVIPTDGGGRAQFDVPADNGGRAITGYQVSLDGGTVWRTLATDGSGPYTAVLAGLVNGTTYSVTFRAVTAFGNGTASTPMSVTPATRPGAPTAVTAVVSGTDVQVSWTAPHDDGGAPIRGYTVTASPGGAQCATTGATLCMVTGLTWGQTYTFAVAADNTNSRLPGTGAGPQGTSDPLDLSAVPGPVTDLTATPGDRRATLSFVPPDADGDNPILRYQVSLDQGRTWTTVTSRTSGGHVVAELGGLLNGHTYELSVRAVSAVGPGESAGPVTVRLATWFQDPVPPAQRRVEIPVPKNPTAFQGSLTWTNAAFRAYDGTPAMPARSLAGHQLQAGQAAVLDDNLFAFDSARLTSAGLAAIRNASASLRQVRSLTCEGYTDYAGDRRHEVQLSQARALAVCAALRSFGVRIGLRPVGYGPARPVVVGGRPQSRSANRRVVLRITG
jgi:outer membrane protein OmpA-like peptidoglycan-associated protein